MCAWRTRDTALLERRFFLGSLLLLCTLVPMLATAQEVRRFELALKAGELPKEQRTIRVKQGDAIELRWTSDKPIHLHLHGYDIEVAVKPGEPTVTALQARIAGRFSVDKLDDKQSAGGHHHGGKVLYFEVHP